MYIPHYSLLFCERPGGRISLFTFKTLHDLFHVRVERIQHMYCVLNKSRLSGQDLPYDATCCSRLFFFALLFYGEEPNRFGTATIRLEEVALLLLSYCGMVMNLNIRCTV